MKYLSCIILFSFSVGSCTLGEGETGTVSWKNIFEEKLDLMGHRNWILVVDKAFPEQSSKGIDLIFVNEDLLPTLNYVLKKIDASTHVRPELFRDMELSYLDDSMVNGIEKLKTELNHIIGDRKVSYLLHEEVFSILDESSEKFRVFVIKTECALPYTSVFIRLDCAYWNPGQEAVLRRAMEQGQ